MKKIIILLTYSLLALCGCNSIIAKEQVLTLAQPIEQTSVQDYSSNNVYFFPDENSVTYKARFTFPEADSLPEEIILSINEVLRLEQGILYELKILYDGDFPGRVYYDWDRFQLGYFYVQEDSIILLRGDNILNEITSVEDIFAKGDIVCQVEELKDSLSDDQKGEHKYISIDGKQCKYQSYNNLIESGFYETFVWEENVGLVMYRSGFGAEKDGIELYLEKK